MMSTRTQTRQTRRHDSKRTVAEVQSKRDRPKNHSSAGAERFTNGNGYDHGAGSYYDSQSHNYQQTREYYDQSYNQQQNGEYYDQTYQQQNGDYYDKNYSPHQNGNYDQRANEEQDPRSGSMGPPGSSLQPLEEVPQLSTSPSASLESGGSIDSYATPYHHPYLPPSGTGNGRQYAGQHDHVGPPYIGSAGQLETDSADLEHVGNSFADMDLNPEYAAKVDPVPYFTSPSLAAASWGTTGHLHTPTASSDPYDEGYDTGDQPAYDDSANYRSENATYTISDEVDDIFAEADEEVTADDWTKAIGPRPATTSRVARAVKVLRYSEGINEKHVTAILEEIHKRKTKDNSRHSSKKTSHSSSEWGRKTSTNTQRRKH